MAYDTYIKIVLGILPLFFTVKNNRLCLPLLVYSRAACFTGDRLGVEGRGQLRAAATRDESFGVASREERNLGSCPRRDTGELK